MKSQSFICLRSLCRLSLPSLLLASLSTYVLAERLVYDYDASGNRISSKCVISTESDLIIDITGVDDFANSGLTVRSLNGTELNKLYPLNVTNEMDLTGYADGVYLLDIITKEESNTWKIIKK